MRKLIPFMLLVCFSITEIEVVASYLLADTGYNVEYSETIPDAESEKGNEHLKDALEKENKSLFAYKLSIINLFTKLSFQYNQRSLLYCSPVQKIPVPPPEYS